MSLKRGERLILEKIENLTGALILRVVMNTKQPSHVNFVHAKCSVSICYETRLKSQSVVLTIDPLYYVSMGLVLLFIIILFHAS